MPQFRKKPVVIEARQWTNTDACREDFAQWFDDHDQMFSTRGSVVEVETSAGTMRAEVGDWILCGVEVDELYPCPASVFAATYERIVAP